MTESKPDEKTIWVICAACGHQSRNHRILHEERKRFVDDPIGGTVYKIDYHRFVQCMGCESYKYVTSTLDPQELDPYEQFEHDFKVYPDSPGEIEQRKAAISLDDARGEAGDQLIPDAVWKMYKETLTALNNGINTLAAGGLRATVEAICLDRGIAAGNLQRKIDGLATQNFLTTAQAELLHEERYLGNAALHELETPSGQAIEDGLGIVEGLINTIYILPVKAERLRNRRQPPADT